MSRTTARTRGSVALADVSKEAQKVIGAQMQTMLGNINGTLNQCLFKRTLSITALRDIVKEAHRLDDACRKEGLWSRTLCKQHKMA